jgi:hypothetical protein
MDEIADRRIPISLEGPPGVNGWRLIANLVGLPPFNGPPATVYLVRGDEAYESEMSEHWFEKAIEFRASSRTAFGTLHWPNPENSDEKPSLSISTTDVVLCHVPPCLLAWVTSTALFDGLDILVMQLKVPNRMEPERSGKVKQAVTTSFSRGHTKHGYAAAFKGAGHDRLPSRRWLAHGPWHLRRLDDAQDISFLQFHELDIPPKLAWRQAYRAHRRLGLADHGGYMIPYDVEGRPPPFEGVYKAADRLLTVVKADTAPQQIDLLHLCQLRLAYRHHPTTPIARLRVLFTDERDAQRHLHELWLRELECWYFDAAGRERRLDDTYAPTRIVPEWVERVEDLPPAGVLARVVAPPPGSAPAGATSFATPGPFPFDPPVPAPDFVATARFALGLAALGVTDTQAALDAVLAYRRRPPAHHDYTLRDGDLVATIPGTQGPDPILAYRTPRADFLAAVRATAHTVDTSLPLARLGVNLPALIVPAPYLEQYPLHPGDAAGLPDGHPLQGVTVLPVDDVLARVSSLDRLDLLPLEALLLLCLEQGDVVAVTAPPPVTPPG